MEPRESERLRELHAQRERITAEIVGLEDGTWGWIHDSRRQAFTPKELAEAFGLTAQAANNRAMKLVRVGILQRKRIPGEGKRFLYERVS